MIPLENIAIADIEDAIPGLRSGPSPGEGFSEELRVDPIEGPASAPRKGKGTAFGGAERTIDPEGGQDVHGCPEARPEDDWGAPDRRAEAGPSGRRSESIFLQPIEIFMGIAGAALEPGNAHGMDMRAVGLSALKQAYVSNGVGFEPFEAMGQHGVVALHLLRGAPSLKRPGAS